MSRYLDPKSDIVFKKIFGSCPHLLKSFLNALLPLPPDAKIESLEYLSAEQVPELPEFKATIVDVKCRDQNGRTFIVEMQIQWVSAFLERVLFNASTAYVRQISRGEAYQKLQQVYGLSILAHKLFDDIPEWYHHYKMMNVKNHEKVLDDIQLVIVELPKFQPVTLQDKRLSILWLRFMSEIDEKTWEVDEALNAVPEIAEALSLAQESAYTPKELISYSAYWDAVSRERTFFTGIKEKMEEVKGKMEEVEGKMEEVEGKMDEVEEKMKGVRKQLKEIGSEKQKLEEKAGELKSQEAKLGEKAGELKSQEAKLGEKAGELKSQEAKLGEKAGELRNQEKKLGEKARALRNQEQKLGEKEEELRKKEEELKEREEKLRKRYKN